MKTLLLASLLLSPYILFHASGGGLAAAAVAAALAAAVAAACRHRRLDALLPTGLAAILGAAFVAVLLFASAGRTVGALVALATGGLMAWTAMIGRPWTAQASAAEWTGMTGDPEFLRVNRRMSAMWAAVIAWQGVTVLAGLGPVANWTPMALAGVLAVLMPHRLVKRALGRRLAEADPHPWQSPLLEAAGDDRADDELDVAVIGAGVGGLTAAALLARAGARVAVFEQHDKPGGFCHCWEGTAWVDDRPLVFRFDAGVHDISGWHEGVTVGAMLARLGLANSLQARRLDHAFVDARGHWLAPRDWDGFVASIARRHPESADPLRALLSDLRTICASMYSTAADRGGVPGQPSTVEGLIRFAAAHPLATRWMQRPLAELMAHHGVDGDARRLVERIGYYVTHRPDALTVAEFAPLIDYFDRGGHYPVGGSGALTQGLADSITMDGGTVRLGAPVERVLASADGTQVAGVRLADGTEIRARTVVYNGDAIAFARQLAPPGALPEAFRAHIGRLEPAMSMFMVHLGVRGEPPPLTPIVHVQRDGIELEIVLPSRVDPSAAPEGYHTVELMKIVSPEEAASWFEDAGRVDPVEQRRSTAYAERKAREADALIAVAESLMPGLAERIVFRREASPLTFRRYGCSTMGSIYGVQRPFGQLRRRSPLKGLVFAGSMIRGAGVEPAMMVGAEAADALLPGLLVDPNRTLP